MPPYEGELSLVGDLLHANEDLDLAVGRILWEPDRLAQCFVSKGPDLQQIGQASIG